jgi:hypothetical protein
MTVSSGVACCKAGAPRADQALQKAGALGAAGEAGCRLYNQLVWISRLQVRLVEGGQW